eukprot:1153647-Pelagomonas_calceolata.AAC.2
MTIGVVLPAGLSDREKLKSIGTLPTSKVYSRLKLGDKKDGEPQHFVLVTRLAFAILTFSSPV